MPLKTATGCLHGRKLRKCGAVQTNLFRGRAQATRVFMGRGLGGFIMVSLRIAAFRWAIGVFIALGVSHVPNSAVAQGLGLPGVGSGIPMPRPPQRSGRQTTGVGTPGQMNPRLAGPSFGGGAGPIGPSPNSAQSRGARMMGPRSSSQLSAISGGGGLMRTGAMMGAGINNRANLVPGSGRTRQQNR